MMYQVTKQFGVNGTPSPCGSFNSLQEARHFIHEKLAEDANMNIKNVIYKLLEGFDEIESYDSNQTIQEQAQSGSRSQSSSVTFSPTPLSNAPRPAGMPHNWVKDKKDDKK